MELNKHNIDEFEKVSLEVLRDNPKGLEEVTLETVEAVEESVKKTRREINDLTKEELEL